MGRAFNGTTQYATVTSAAVTAAPFSMGLWFSPDVINVDQSLMIVSSDLLNTEYFELFLNGTTSKLQCRTVSAASSMVATVTTACSTNTWYHALAVFASNQQAHVYLNGGSKGSKSNFFTTIPTNINQGGFAARFVTDTADKYFDGDLGCAALWDAALNDTEAAILGEGFYPTFVRPQNLVSLWPFLRASSPEIETINKREAVLVLSPPTTRNPRVFFPTSQQFPRPVLPPPGGLPLFLPSYRRRRID